MPPATPARIAIVVLAVLAAALPAATATIPVPALPADARLALCGDSITEQRLYTSYVEAYLLACAGRQDISVFQFGWGGENADQFGNRIDRGDLDAFMPTAAVIAYGANDGANQVWQPWVQTMWTGRVNGILSRLKRRYPATAACTVISSPTLFQVNSEGTNAAAVAVSNDTLGRFRDLDIGFATEHATGFADVRQRMVETAAAAQAALGPAYRFAGRDGVHPGPNGHLMIAYEVLRALACGGEIATITIDAAGAASASAGHRLVDAGAGTLRLVSTRYPFRFAGGDPPGADAMAGILPFLPFNRDLNRFVLVVRNLGGAGARVAWGDEAHDFTAAELAAGVNLAAAFERTPFDGAFAELLRRIGERQAKEREMIKAAGDATAPAKGWTAADVTARNALDAAVHAALVPVEHRIVITPMPAGR